MHQHHVISLRDLELMCPCLRSMHNWVAEESNVASMWPPSWLCMQVLSSLNKGRKLTLFCARISLTYAEEQAKEV